MQPAYLNPRERVQRLCCVFQSGVGVLPLQEHSAHTVDFEETFTWQRDDSLALENNIVFRCCTSNINIIMWKEEGWGTEKEKKKKNVISMQLVTWQSMIIFNDYITVAEQVLSVLILFIIHQPHRCTAHCKRGDIFSFSLGGW